MKFTTIKNKIIYSTISSAWLFNSTKVLYSLLIVPFILLNFTPEEINIWFLLFSIIGISEMMIFGFNSTFIRFFSYTMSGIHYTAFGDIKNTDIKEVSFDKNYQLYQILKTLKMLFLVVTAIYGLLVWFGGSFALKKPMSYLNNPEILWSAWVALFSANVFRILTYPYSIFLQGLNKMNQFYITGAVFNVALILINFGILFFNPSIKNLVFANSIIISLTSISYFLLFRYYKNKEYTAIFTTINWDLISIIWAGAWRSGITKIVAPIIQYISGILFAQIASPLMSSSYLLTQRIFQVLESFSNITVNAKLPIIGQLRGRGKLEEVNKLILKLSFIAYGVLVFGSIVITSMGGMILSFLHSNILLPGTGVLALFGFGHMFGRSGGFQLNLSNQANNVIEHIAIIIFSLIYFGILICFYNRLDIWVFPFSLLIASLITNTTYIYPRSYKLYNSTFWKSEKYAFVPMILILIIFNSIIFII